VALARSGGERLRPGTASNNNDDFGQVDIEDARALRAAEDQKVKAR